jgi:hypothetical protein
MRGVKRATTLLRVINETCPQASMIAAFILITAIMLIPALLLFLVGQSGQNPKVTRSEGIKLELARQYRREGTTHA